MVEEKGLAPDSADKIGGFVNGNAGGAKELWAKLTEEKKFGDHPVRFKICFSFYLNNSLRTMAAFLASSCRSRQRSVGFSRGVHSSTSSLLFFRRVDGTVCYCCVFSGSVALRVLGGSSRSGKYAPLSTQHKVQSGHALTCFNHCCVVKERSCSPEIREKRNGSSPNENSTFRGRDVTRSLL